MKIALVAPSGVPFVVGGAEKLWWGLTQYVNRCTPHELELIKLPSPERNFWEVVESYERFSTLELGHFDAVLSTKYPAWMVAHPNHVVYLQHTLRGLYDCWPRGLATRLPSLPGRLAPLGRLLASERAERAMLADIFGLLRLWRAEGGAEGAAAQALTAFPGALIRALVHKFDAIALAPGAVRRHAAISQTVARRAGYFPAGVDVTVLPHPSNLEGLEAPPLGEEFVFTASRLDGPKRVDLIIDAYRHCRTELPLLIAGDGPMAAAWQERARADARVRFVGRISDLELVEHYRRAALVVFVPKDEDMGLITLEAMQAGKPVVTVQDSGGVAEFVRDGVNGRVCAVQPQALARAIDEVLADADVRTAMGHAARVTAAAVSWQRTTDRLLAACRTLGVDSENGPQRGQFLPDSPPHSGAMGQEDGKKWAAAAHSQPTIPKSDRLLDLLSSPGACTVPALPAANPFAPAAALGAGHVHTANHRPRLLVLNTFAVWPPDSGGKKRIYHLYEAIAEWADVTLLTLLPQGAQGVQRVYAPRLREVAVPMSAAFARCEGQLARQLKRSVGDIAALLHWPLLDDYAKAFATLQTQADVVVASHCYFGPLIEARWQGEVWYDAHNVEADMKADVLGVARLAPDWQLAMPSCPLPPWPDAQQAVWAVAAAERALVQRARRVWAVSAEDRQRLTALYGRAAQEMELAPNGTVMPGQVALDPMERAERKRRLGVEPGRGLALFVGSNHGPNNQAARRVLAWAQALPEWLFVLAGSVCDTLPMQLPSNVLPLGRLPEAQLWVLLGTADVGLNPMEQGSGTNLKILDYAAHGMLVLSTPTGLRGGALKADEHAVAAALENFVVVLRGLEADLPGPRAPMRRAAHAIVHARGSWSGIGRALQEQAQKSPMNQQDPDGTAGL